MQKRYPSRAIPIAFVLSLSIVPGRVARAAEPAPPAAARQAIAQPAQPLVGGTMNDSSSEGLVFVPSPVPNGGTMVNLQGRFLTTVTATEAPAQEIPAKSVSPSEVHSAAPQAGGRKE